MADTVDVLVAEIRTVVDVTADEALTALNRKHRTMVGRARSLRKNVTLGTTVADTAFYAAPAGIVELYEINLDGVPMAKARQPDIYGYSDGSVVWVGPTGSGLVVEDANSSGAIGLTLIPTPDEDGLVLDGYAAVLPDDLATGGAATTIKVDSDFYDALVEGACATLLARIGEGNPDRLEARFDLACEELRRRVKRRLRGGGPTLVRVLGINA